MVHIYKTPPNEQDATQGRFLDGAKATRRLVKLEALPLLNQNKTKL